MDRYTEQVHIMAGDTLPDVLKPLLFVNRIFGTFPYKVTLENGKIILTSKSIHFYHSLLAMFLIAIPAITAIYRSVELILSGPAADSPIMGKLIEHLCALYANYITAISLGMLFLHRKTLARFFNETITYSKAVEEYMDVDGVHQKVRKMFILYSLLAMISISSIGSRYFDNPSMGPLTVVYELTGLNLYLAPLIRSVLSTIFVAYLTLAKFSCLGYVEIVSSALGTCFSRVIENLCEYLEDQEQVWRRQFRGLARQVVNKDDFLNLLSSSPTPPSNKNKMQSDFDSYINQINELNPGLISPPPLDLHHPDKGRSSPDSAISVLKVMPGKALCHAARKFQCVATMQTHANAVFGITLAINMGCVVAMSVILKYLVITSIAADWKAAALDLKNGMNMNMTKLELPEVTLTDIYPPLNDTLKVNSSSSASAWNSSSLESLDWLMFLGVDLTMLIRLGVVTISLGKVHRASLQFNSVMGKAYLAATQLMDEFAEVLATTTSSDEMSGTASAQMDDVTRMMMTPTQTSSLLAFMNLYNANPVAFTAGGLFVFSRG